MPQDAQLGGPAQCCGTVSCTAARRRRADEKHSRLRHNYWMDGCWQNRDYLIAALKDARRRTFTLVSDLNEEQLSVPLLPVINPIVWEIGHVGWFQEKWVLRHARGQPPLI